MKRLLALMMFAVSLGAAAQSGDCASYMTLSSTPSGCDASGSVTADVSECSTSISEGSPVMQALYEGFAFPGAFNCLELGAAFGCEETGLHLHASLSNAGVSHSDLMNELQTHASSSLVMQALYEGLQVPYLGYCLEGYYYCELIGSVLALRLCLAGVSYSDLMNELQALAGGLETSDCIVSWSDSTGNSVGEGFSISGLAAGTYTASLTHSNGCTDSQTIEVLLECNGCTHENATNYNSTATFEDGSCLYNQGAFDAGYEAAVASVECPPCANSDCPGDFTADGYIGVDDILSMLSLYDTSCSQ